MVAHFFRDSTNWRSIRVALIFATVEKRSVITLKYVLESGVGLVRQPPEIIPVDSEIDGLLRSVESNYVRTRKKRDQYIPPNITLLNITVECV